MGQASSTFISHPDATVTIPGQGKIVGCVAKDVITGQLKSQRYAGIPYAQPPVGSLRWKRPQPLASTFRYDSDARQYVEFAAQCPQATNYALTNRITLPDKPVHRQSEDCLYLNIWTPTSSDASRSSSNLAVLFFIHGGWLQIGNAHFAPDRDPSDLIHTAGLDAIVVTAAYRLNAFGFFAHNALRSEDPHGLTGNYGFWDQRAAIEWVHTNIKHFGGDPNNITVSGLSAGAHSTHSQLLHEFDLSTSNPQYKPIIKRVFLQSNSAIWPSKTVDETEGQLEELCSLLNISAHLNDSDKIAKLRQIDDITLVQTLAKMDMHTFRATRDSQQGTFVRSDWTNAMMDGRFGRWCHKQDIRFVIGECDDEEWVYRYINTPTDKASLVRQVNNYYTLPLVEKMLPYYGVPMCQTSSKSRHKQTHSGNITPASVGGETTFYSTLGVKPSASLSEIRSAYLSKVRLYHPDKLQQQGKDGIMLVDTVSESDELIRQLNHAYETLIDDLQRARYDHFLAASQSSSAHSKPPRICATVDFEAFQPLLESDATSIKFGYDCRCGSVYMITEPQIHDRMEVICCDGCSENIRVRYDDDDDDDDDDDEQVWEEQGRHSCEEIVDIFGRICSDSQVYIAERILITDLISSEGRGGGLSPSKILRYRINYRPKIIDQAVKTYSGMSHSFDDFIWWFTALNKGQEEYKVKQWLEAWKQFIYGDENVEQVWYDGKKPNARLIRIFESDGSIKVEKDQRWDEKEVLIAHMIKVRAELADML
ncbi:related to Acetylcholinesterase precursor [Melanopsichium pennsylvanicum]|uniref:Diphthamide biosynthesis protein 4 n=1 Tax=Melanopsichium pennsylvanicum TaxID=63383 RepID=A0AAJ4XIG0_9BASI|nr:related to Acetylcholinesterase precursor [Melanopsichium pennsylvanicum]